MVAFAGSLCEGDARAGGTGIAAAFRWASASSRMSTTPERWRCQCLLLARFTSDLLP